MVWKNLARIAAASAEAVGRAFARAVKEELNASKQAASRQTQHPGTSAGSGSGSARSTSTQQSGSSRAAEQQRKAMELNARLGITLQESMQILEVKPPLDAEEIRRRYDHLFAVNDKQKGGTLYLQAKIYRAKERLDAELARLEQEKKEKEEEKKSTSMEEEEQRKRDE